MISLFENNRNSDDIDVYLIGKDISDSNKRILSEITKEYKRNITFFDIDKLPIPKYLENNGRWPSVCYARLFSPELLINVDRILYLDCDTLVIDEITELFTDKYSDSPIYGCKDFIGNWYKRLIGMPINAVNINGGVILLNLNKMRELNSTKMITFFLNKYGRNISYADQDILNGTFWNYISVLDASYDVMSIMKVFKYKEIIQLKHPKACYTENEVNEALKKPKIIHFTGNYRTIRPWFKNSNHPYRDQFEKYKNLSPWKNLELQEVKNSGEVAIANKIRNLPTWFSCNLLGFLYCVIRPLKIYLKGKNL